MTIKSAHITNYFHKDSGGISTAYRSLLDAAERRKRHMRLIVPSESESVEELSEFTKIYYVRAMRSPVFDKRYRLIMPWQYIPTNSALRHILLDEMPDMVEVRDKYTLSAFGTVVRINMFRRLKRPMLVSYSSERMDDNVGSFISGAGLPRWFARRYIGNYIFPSYDFHITNSPYTAEEYFLATKREHNPNRQHWFTNLCWRSVRSPRVPVDERIRISPAGVDADRFSPEHKSEKVRREMIEKAGFPDDAVIMLYAGRISPEKNVGLLLDLVRSLAGYKERDLRLLIAGGGPMADRLQKQADRDVPNRIFQFGHLDKETLANYYANADVFVHPNPREPFGIGPLEAMASGLPVVAPNSGGLLFYATQENAWLVEPTGEDFASAVKAVMADPAARSRKIEKGFEAVRANSRSKAADRLFDTYDELYEDFRRRNDLYTDRQVAKKHDYKPLFD